MQDVHYDWEGEPISLEAWVELFADKRHIGDTDVGDVRVSTVWLGLDHSFGAGPPLIFETMIFGGEHHGDCWRYATEREARDGHADVVAQIAREAEITPPSSR